MQDRLLIIFDHSRQCAGGQWSLVFFLEVLLRLHRSFDVCVVYHRDNLQLARELQRLRLRGRPINYGNNFFRRVFDLTNVINTERRHRPSMVFYGNTFEGGFWSALFGCLFSKRSLFRVRLSPHLFPHPIIDFYIFLLNKKLIFNSFFVEQEFKRRFPFLARVKSGLTVYNYMGGVSDYAKSDYGLGEVLTFAVVGRFEPIKNQAVVPIVAKYMKERGFSGFKILMIGHDDLRDEGAYRKEVASAIAALEVADVCEIVQDRATPAEVYSGVDVVLTLSRCEALPRVICESGLFGIRNIAVNAAGNKELIEGDPGGVPITDFEPRAVAEACIGVLQNKADLPILGQKSQAYYQALFSVDNTVKVELKLIETLF